MPSKSSSKRRDQILDVMPRKKAEAILMGLVNRGSAVELRASHERLVKHYPELFEDSENSFKSALLLAYLLQKAWDATEERKRDWYLHDAESFYRAATRNRDVPTPPAPTVPLAEYFHRGVAVRFPDPPAQVTPFEALLYHFRRNLKRAKHCLNPDCVAPYFFVRKKGQRYCSDACSLPAQRAAKLRWWNENRRKKQRKA